MRHEESATEQQQKKQADQWPASVTKEFSGRFEAGVGANFVLVSQGFVKSCYGVNRVARGIMPVYLLFVLPVSQAGRKTVASGTISTKRVDHFWPDQRTSV